MKKKHFFQPLMLETILTCGLEKFESIKVQGMIGLPLTFY